MVTYFLQKFITNKINAVKKIMSHVQNLQNVYYTKATRFLMTVASHAKNSVLTWAKKLLEKGDGVADSV